VTSYHGQGTEAELSADQADAYSLAAYTCAVQYPILSDQRGTLTEAQKALAYEYLTVDLVDCLERAGFEISDIPSRESFIAAYDSGAWNPYMQIQSTISAAEWNTLAGECVPNTPPEVLYGK